MRKRFEAFYRYAFSVPEAKGIVMWGFWPKEHIGAVLNASIVKCRLVDSTLPEQKYFDLMDRIGRLQVTEQPFIAGEVGFRGFHGEYLVTTTRSGNQQSKKLSSRFRAARKMKNLDVELVLNTTRNSLTIYGTE